MATVPTPSLRDKLDIIANRHRESVQTLRTFVSETLKNFLASSDNWYRILQDQMTHAAMGGTLPPLRSSATLGVPPVDMQREIVERLQKAQEDFLRMRKDFPGLLLEMALIYRVALFDAFLADVIAAVLGTLTPTEAQMAPLVETMTKWAERESGKGNIRNQASWIRDNFGLEIFTDEAQCGAVDELMERRNLYVHGNGLVNEKYARRFPSLPYTIGQRLFVDNGYWAVSDQHLQMVSEAFVYKVLTKFCPPLPTTSTASPTPPP
jgi:hypothetical protein